LGHDPPGVDPSGIDCYFRNIQKDLDFRRMVLCTDAMDPEGFLTSGLSGRIASFGSETRSAARMAYQW
jgi:hypothetical protein